MRKLILTLTAFMLTMPAWTQTIGDKELASLVGAVLMLRTQTPDGYDRAAGVLRDDTGWTPMNELGALRENECANSEGVPGFKLNRILTQIERSRTHRSSQGLMLNGEDERYDYSLCERSVRGGRSVTYVLRGREGVQTFVIVPFEEGGLSAWVSAGGEESAFAESDGLLTATCTSESKDSEVRIIVTDSSGRNRSFVLLNHNSRRR